LMKVMWLIAPRLIRSERTSNPEPFPCNVPPSQKEDSYEVS
jgi:hypothetical protein